MKFFVVVRETDKGNLFAVADGFSRGWTPYIIGAWITTDIHKANKKVDDLKQYYVPASVKELHYYVEDVNE